MCGNISNSYATGSVSTSLMDFSDIGGLVGYTCGNISNSYATGNVSLSSMTDSDIGGLVGFDDGSISNCFATGSISITSGCVGGIAGWSRYGYIYDSYWDIDTTGQNYCTYNGKNGNSGNNGKHTAEMQQQSTFTGWDFLNIWKIYEGISYPFLFEPTTNSKDTLGARSYCLYGKGSVNLSTGNFVLAQTDLSIPSVGPSLNFSRFYNSQDDYKGIQGKGWTNNYNVHLTINQDNSISVAYEDGHVYFN